jgi:hypothetical protein
MKGSRTLATASNIFTKSTNKPANRAWLSSAAETAARNYRPRILTHDEHLGSVITLMKLNDDYDSFRAMRDRMHPVYRVMPLFAGMEDI